MPAPTFAPIAFDKDDNPYDSGAGYIEKWQRLSANFDQVVQYLHLVGLSVDQKAAELLSATAQLLSEAELGESGGTLGELLASLLPGITFAVVEENLVAQNRSGIIAKSSEGGFSITLPADPVEGWRVVVVDGGSLAEHPVTVSGNGQTINGIETEQVLSVSQLVADFIFDGETWRLFVPVTADGKQNLMNKSFGPEQVPLSLAQLQAIALSF